MIRFGSSETVLHTGQVGWLYRPSGDGTSVLRVVAGESGARLILYAGQPQGDPKQGSSTKVVHAK
jgi:hypothetical protein